MSRGTRKCSPPSSALNKRPKSPRLTVYHVGSRENYVPIKYPHHFDEDVEFILFEAGQEESCGCVFLLDGRPSKSRFIKIPHLAWSRNQSIDFYERECPYTSGIHKFNDKYADWYFFGNGECDYILGQTHKAQHSCVKQAITLDTIAEELGKQSSPTVLCIDAQGASMEVLKGARQLISGSTLGVVCEVEFEQFYKGSALFGEVHKYLLCNNFHFLGLLPEEGWGLPVRSPVGLRSKSLTSSADALFIKNPFYVASTRDTRLAAAYLLLCHAWKIVDLVGPVLPFIKREKCKSSTHEFASLVADHWSAIFKSGKFCARDFQSKKNDSKVKMRNQYQLQSSKTRRYYPNEGWSEYEKALKTYGFSILAHDIRKKRIKQQKFIQ